MGNTSKKMASIEIAEKEKEGQTTHTATTGPPVLATAVAPPNENVRKIQTFTSEEESVFCVLDPRSRGGTQTAPLGPPVLATVVAAPNENIRIIQTLTSEEESVFCVLDFNSRGGTQCALPGLQDDVMALNIVKKPFVEYGIDWYVEEYEIDTKYESAEWDEVLGVVGYDEQTEKVTVVGRSFPTATLVPYSFPKKLQHPTFGVVHDLVMGRVRRLRPMYTIKEMFGCVAIVKDNWEKAEFPSKSIAGCMPVSIQHMPVGIRCMLTSIRPLMDLERKHIAESCRDMEELSLREAQLFIRDVFMAIPLMEAYVCNQSVSKHRIQAFGTSSIDVFNSSYKIDLHLDKQQKQQCIDSTALHAWRVDQELSLGHPGMLQNSRKFRGIQEVSVVIDKIEEDEDSKTVVTLKPANSSKDFFDLAMRMKFEFDATEPFTIGPSENTYSTVIENLETYFDRFFANKKLFDWWRGATELCQDGILDLYKAFSVNGSILDESQTVALRTAISRSGFTSVEAPPGSGKTFLITALVALKNEQDSVGSTYISAPTNAAIDNAIAMIRRELPKITSARRYSKKTEGNLSEKMKEVSLLQQAIDCKNVDMTHHEELQSASVRYNRAKKQLENAPEFRQGLPRLRAKAGSEQGLKQSYFKALKPKVYGATCELIARRETRVDFKVANEIKEGRQPLHKDLELCVTHLIIDEASQLPMYQFLSMLVGMPMVNKITIVGDSKQLGPHSGLEERSFARKLIKGGELGRVQRGKGTSKTNLATIYRCHPAILKLIYTPLYGELSSGTTAKERNLAAEMKLPLAQDEGNSPLIFVHNDGRCIDAYNQREIEIAIDYLQQLKKKEIPNEDIAVVCHHRKQRGMLSVAIKENGMSMTVNTVDSFQGKEAKFVLLLTTKTCEPTQNPNMVFHFVADFNRETVALTRAQHQLVVIGQLDQLVKTPFWRQYIPAIVEHRALVTSDWNEADRELYDRVSVAAYKK